jgi:GntR family transcriptional regulator/MocR family aminotransferase
MQVVLSIDPSDTRTLQRQLFDQIRELILNDKLRSGDPVPASRSLSEQLGVSRNTVILAYEQLLSEGYIESRPNVGTFVSSDLPERVMAATSQSGQAEQQANDNYGDTHPLSCGVGAQMVISPNRGKLDFDFWVGRTDASTFPANEWRRILDAKVRYGGARLAEYQDPQGLPELRQAISDHIGPARGVSASPEHIIVVNGSQDGLSLISRVLAGYARTFVHEDPCYQGARFLFQSCGFSMQPVPVDNDGIDVDRLPKTRRSLLYVTPSHQYPLGVTLSLERRLKLLEWAARTDSFIIEDDYDGDFRYEGAPLTALRGLDRGGRVLYVGTFSKSLAAGLRLGFIVAPPSLARSFREWKSLASNGTPWLEQAAMAEFMNSSGFIRHLRRIRAIYKTRRDLVAASLRQSFGDAEIKGLRGGMHLSLRVPRRFGPAPEIEKEAAQRGVGIYTPGKGGAFISPDHPRAGDTLLFGYAALPEKNIRTAMARLAKIAAARERVLVNG